LSLALEIPPGFGRDLRLGAGRKSASGWMAQCHFRGETARGYMQGLHLQYIS
jgi:ribosome-dependent ATPase